MATRRSYADACPLARALDVVGERWALIVVRELLFGPRRFSDLRRALPGASTNMLTDRLRELADHGVVSQRRLPAPAASAVYELTEHGRALMPALEALGAWGGRLPRPGGEPTLSAVSVLWFVRGCRRAASHPARRHLPCRTRRRRVDDPSGLGANRGGVGRDRPPEHRPSHRPDDAHRARRRPGGPEGIAAGTIEITGSARSARRLLRDAHASAAR